VAVSVVAPVTGGRLPASVRIRAGAVGLHCLVWGAETDPSAVLVHGNGAHAHWWDPLVPALVPGWRLHAPDLRGHGESDWPEPPAYRLSDLGEDLDAVLDALGPRPVVLVGHSMGGRIAVWVAARRPERVRALVLLDTRMRDADPDAVAAWRGQIGGRRHGRIYPTRAAAEAAFRFVPDEPDVPPAVVADLAHHAVVERRPGEWTYRFDRAVLRLDADGAGDLSAMLGRVRCPTLLMAGERSWVMDAAERESMAASLPAATLRVFPGGHHFLVAHAGPVGAVLRGFMDGL
jgi:pimeloyl-ACP methyl ester carboxylesterase